MSVRDRLQLWFSVTAPVGRRDYLIAGMVLMAVKYAGEAALLWFSMGKVLTPLAFVDPVVIHRANRFGETGAWLVFVWSLPFLWLGLSLSTRRAADAGRSPRWGIIFLVPLVNWLVMAFLASVPSRPPLAVPAQPAVRGGHPTRLAVVLAALAASLATTGVMTAFSIYVLGTYGSSLFIATPVMMGVVSAMVARRYDTLGLKATLGIGQTALLLGLLLMIALAVEGAICVLMAWVLAAPLVAVGGLLGYAIGGGGRGAARSGLMVALLSLPLLAWQESAQRPATLREVVSTIEVDAPPDVVWRHVVAFPDLPPPDGIFALGIACPLRARIVGEGVGATRFCEFTTGDFVEPITVWDPPRRLAFDVTAQPPAMRELSPWPAIHAPHLDGYLRSRRGEFRLIALPGGRTRLEGSTWYQVEVHPQAYWACWSDFFIHAIHKRVLGHIAGLAAADRSH